MNILQSGWLRSGWYQTRKSSCTSAILKQSNRVAFLKQHSSCLPRSAIEVRLLPEQSFSVVTVSLAFICLISFCRPLSPKSQYFLQMCNEQAAHHNSPVCFAFTAITSTATTTSTSDQTCQNNSCSLAHHRQHVSPVN
jgi:hypothetical protein